MSKSKKKRIVIVIVILIALCVYFVIGDIRNNLTYNTQLQEVKTKYQILHNDLEALIDGDVPVFQNIDYEFAFFFNEYIEWEKMYIKRDEVNRLPDEDMAEKLAIADEDFNALFVEVDLL